MHKIELEYIEYDEKMSSKDIRQHEHNVAYNLLYKMLKECFNILNPIVLKTENGKPYVENEGVHFSISHTNGLAVCVVADTPVGVDCERIVTKSSEEIQKFANRFFVENEISLLENGVFSSNDFFKLWTAKEATIKKLGTNLSDIKNIDVTLENIQYLEENGYIISINI